MKNQMIAVDYVYACWRDIWVIIKERKGGERESWASGSRIAGQCQQQLREWMQEAKRRGDRVMGPQK